MHKYVYQRKWKLYSRIIDLLKVNASIGYIGIKMRYSAPSLKYKRLYIWSETCRSFYHEVSWRRRLQNWIDECSRKLTRIKVNAEETVSICTCTWKTLMGGHSDTASLHFWNGYHLCSLPYASVWHILALVNLFCTFSESRKMIQDPELEKLILKLMIALMIDYNCLCRSKK